MDNPYYIPMDSIYDAFYQQDVNNVLLVYKNYLYSIYHYKNDFFIEESLFNNGDILHKFNKFKCGYPNSYLMRDYSLVPRVEGCNPEFIKFNYSNTNNVLLFGVFTIVGICIIRSY